MPLAVTEEELRELLAAWPFISRMNFQVRALDDGLCTLEVPFQEVSMRPGGRISGPTYMAAADAAVWFAIMTRLGKDDPAVTAEMKTNFLGAAREEPFFCTARILKWGRRLIYAVVECTNAQGKLLAHHTVTYIRLDEGRETP
ncbi:MAG: PaaI family thioesterase [Ktedonobacteraceae bacterium]